MMKLEIKRDKPSDEPVAYIDKDGDLIIRDSSGYQAGGLDLENPGRTFRELPWEPYGVAPENLIFPGDRVVLTF